LNLTFRKMILLSVLTVILGVSLVYGLSLELKTENSTQPGSSSTPSPASWPPFGYSYLLVFAYNGDNQSAISSAFVQASVTITGPENHNGTTTTDPQNPLRFLLAPGQYSVLGTYGSAVSQNVTVKVTAGGICDAFLNFSSSPVPLFGHILVTAWNTNEQPNGGFVSYRAQASVTITGPEDHNGTTGTDPKNDLIFTVTPGEYSVLATYGSASSQNQTVDVAAGSVSNAEFFFGNAPLYPPP